MTQRLSVSGPLREPGRLKYFIFFLCTHQSKVHSFNISVSPYSLTYLTKCAKSHCPLQLQSPFVNHHFLDHQILFIEFSGECNCEPDPGKCVLSDGILILLKTHE